MVRKRKFVSRLLRKQEKDFIQKSCALGFSRQAAYKSVQAFRHKKGIRTNKRSVYAVYSKALKHPHVKKARRTVKRNLFNLGYSKKGRRQRMNALINSLEKVTNLKDLFDVPELDSP